MAPTLRKRTLVLTASLLLACTSVVGAQSSTDRATQNTDWTVGTGNFGSQRYSPLDQINKDNVDQLEVAWRWSSPDNQLVKDNEKLQNLRMQLGSHEVSPVKIGNDLFVTTGYSQTAAIDATTGKTKWIYDPKSYDHGRPPNLGFVHRGAAHWSTPEGQARIFYASGDAFLRSIDATTGEPVGGFGENGAVDLTKGMRREFPRRGYSVNSPVVLCRDVVIVGSQISDGATNPLAPPGDVRGFDPITGKQLWTFRSVPQEGEFGNDTWLEDSWKVTGNTNVWTLLSADEELGLAYLPFGTPTNDWYGGHRKGDNLFGEALVAVDCKTGERRWHFQAVHHGLWDYDLVTSPILGDVTVNGKTIQAVFQLTKQAFLFAFDRKTGEPIWPIEERPVPQSTVPGEVSSKTQPFPTKPPPYEPQGITEDNLMDLTPELFEEAKKILANYNYGPLYTPPSHERETLNLPGWAGGSSWQGGAFDPETGFLYVPSFTIPIGVLLKKPDASRSAFNYVAGINPMIRGPQDLPLMKPPLSRLTAYDMNKGEIEWWIPLGNGPRDHPALKGLDLPPLGDLARHHVLVTKTLLIVNSSAGLGRGYSPEDMKPNPYLRFFDKVSGKLLREIELPVTTDGSPITYMQDGRQYLVFAMGGREVPAELVAYALPR